MMGSDTETTVGRVFLAVIGAICLAAAFGPSLQMLRDSVWKTTFARLTITSGGSLLIYLGMIVIVASLSWMIIRNALDTMVAGRSAHHIAPLVIADTTPATVSAGQMTSLLQGSLIDIAAMADKAQLTEDDLRSFQALITRKTPDEPAPPNSVAPFVENVEPFFQQLNIGPSPVSDAVKLDGSTKFVVAGTDVSQFASWLLDFFQRRDTVEVTILRTATAFKISWNADTARSRMNRMVLPGTLSWPDAIQSFAWEYARGLNESRASTPALEALSWQQYQTLMLAYAEYAAALRDAGSGQPELIQQRFQCVLNLVTMGAAGLAAAKDPIVAAGTTGDACVSAEKALSAAAKSGGGQPEAAAAAPEPPKIDLLMSSRNTGSLTDAPAQWWELGKFITVTALLAGNADVARRYAFVAVSLMDSDTRKKHKNIYEALDAIAYPKKIGAGSVSASEKAADPQLEALPPHVADVGKGLDAGASNIGLVTEKPLEQVLGRKPYTGNAMSRGFVSGKLRLITSVEPVQGPISAIEQIELLQGEADGQAPFEFVFHLPLSVYQSNLFRKYVKDNLANVKVTIYLDGTQSQRNALAKSLSESLKSLTVILVTKGLSDAVIAGRLLTPTEAPISATP